MIFIVFILAFLPLNYEDQLFKNWEILHGKRNLKEIPFQPYYLELPYKDFNLFIRPFHLFSNDSVWINWFGFSLIYKRENLSLNFMPYGIFGTDSLYPPRRFKKTFRSNFLLANLKWETSFGGLVLGRTPIKIGESPRFSLFLDNSMYPPDFIILYLDFWKIRFIYGFCMLEKMFAPTTTFYGDTSRLKWGNRFFSFHSINFYPQKTLKISLSEGVLWGGSGIPPYFFFINPFTIYYAEQFNNKVGFESNISWLFSFKKVFPNWNFSVFFEYLIDDYQYKKDKFGEPNMDAFVLGFEKLQRWSNFEAYLSGEYTKITRWVYNYRTPFGRWTYYSYPLGHPYGTDLEVFYLMILPIKIRKNYLGFEFQRLNKGEGKINSYWPIPYLWEPDPKEYQFPPDNFLVGNVRKINTLLLVFHWEPRRSIRIIPKIGLVGENPHFSLKLSADYSN